MQYRVEELAAAAAVRVDTVRFYQTKGLLPRPRRVKRAALYSQKHLSLLKRIRRYQAQGLSLAVIKRLLAGPPRSKVDALFVAVANQSGERCLTRAQLASASGVPEALLAALERAGLLQPSTVGGRARYGEADLQMVRAGLVILEQGFPLDELLRLSMRHARGVQEVVGTATELFDRHVRKAGTGSANAEAVASAFRQLLPAVTTLVALHFQRTLLNDALDRLRQTGDQEGLRAAATALEGGHLEVRWR
ncbi:MAG: MerR family transcriptional regulator [Candidatus Binatia bacterium]